MRRWVHRGHGVTASVSGKPHTRHFTAASWLLGAMGGLNDFTSILERKCLPHRLGKPVEANHHGGWALANAVDGDGCAGPSLVNAGECIQSRDGSPVAGGGIDAKDSFQGTGDAGPTKATLGVKVGNVLTEMESFVRCQ